LAVHPMEAKAVAAVACAVCLMNVLR